MRSTLFVVLAAALLAPGCWIPITNAYRWDIPPGEGDRFSADSDACAYEATPQLQPELPDEVNPDEFRSCMKRKGWREQ